MSDSTTDAIASDALSPKSFSLQGSDGKAHDFPAATHSLVCFVKEDCPTCNLVMPLLDAIFRQWGTQIAVLLPGQTQAGNAQLIANHGLQVPVLDDSALAVSYAWNLDTVPTLVAADAQGNILGQCIGFDQKEWQSLLGQMQSHADLPELQFDWSNLPAWRPGCGSLSVDPLIADRLAAEADDSPIRARKIQIAAADDVIEFMFDQGFTDGLPVVPPTAERVVRMLSGTPRDAQEVVAVVPPNMAEATVEKIAINAVMAGCKPEYLPVVIAAMEAACTDEFNIHGVMATTMGASPVMVVNGPIRHKLGMNMQLGALGRGNRANATIGRALRLAIQNIGGSHNGGTDRSTLGSPMKFTMCFAEYEERSNWSPLHVERGFAAEDSVVTLYPGTSGPQALVDQKSRGASQLVGSWGMMMKDIHHPRAYNMQDCLVVVCPEHVDTIANDGWDKAQVRSRIQEVTAVPMRDLVANELSGEGLDAEKAAAMEAAKLDQSMTKFLKDEMIHLVVAGSGAGKFSALIHGWVGGAMGSAPVSRKIDM